MRIASLCAVVVILTVVFPEATQAQESCVSDCECPAGSFCQPTENGGQCNEGVCPSNFDPVCGFDGVTYSNECMADLQRVGVAHAGECTESKQCGGIAGVMCGKGMFCDPSECGVADATGQCVPIQDACTEEFQPVCGCDGKTYGNDCKRQMAQVGLAHTGACENEESTADCDCCRASVISADGQIIWSHDPALASVMHLSDGHYRLQWSVDVAADAFFIQPIAPQDDFPRSLLAWPATTGADQIDVNVDAHFVNGTASHDHRENLDVRFSLLRCPGNRATP